MFKGFSLAFTIFASSADASASVGFRKSVYEIYYSMNSNPLRMRLIKIQESGPLEAPIVKNAAAAARPGL
jgi:hypothetical protein